MPEGPEARTVADKLRPLLLTKIITDKYIGDRGKSIGFDNLTCPATIIGVRSYGKKVLIDLDSCHMIIVSLGMSGRLQYTQGNHSHIRFDISDAKINGSFKVLKYLFSLFFDDTRYMGSVDIIPNNGISLYFNDIGPDLLQLAINDQTWIPNQTWLNIFNAKKLRKRAICDVLIDQSVLAGIGWYLQTDILYYSAIHPERIVETISVDECERIRINSHKVMLLAYSHGGFTIESFISPDGETGKYPAAVYGKKHDPIGNLVVNKRLSNGRTAHFVPAIQH
jgi:formamidopyrimidine-DNA glycosylase